MNLRPHGPQPCALPNYAMLRLLYYFTKSGPILQSLFSFFLNYLVMLLIERIISGVVSPHLTVSFLHIKSNILDNHQYLSNPSPREMICSFILIFDDDIELSPRKLAAPESEPVL